MDTLIHSDQSDVKIRIPSAIFSLRNDRGITLLEVVIVGAIGTLIAMAVGDLLIASSKWRLRLETKAALQSVSQEIRILLENDGSWQTTLTHADNATTFACLTGPSGCTTGGSFSIFHRNGERAFDGLSGTLAYTAKGTRCDSFPNGSCMYRMTIDWVPGCTSACSAWIPVHLRATWSSTAENSFNLRLLNVHATKYIRNPAPPTGTAPVVSFGFGLGTQILTTEGANFNYQLRLNTPVSEAVSVEVCRSAGFAGSPSLIGSLTSAGQYTLTPEQFDSGAGYDCNTHVIPRGSTTVTVTETVYDDNMTTNENTSAFIYLLWIQGSRQAEIGINNVFNVYVRDNDTYLELLSITDVGDSYDITYRHNLTFCARLKVEPNPPWLMSSLCAIAPSTLSMICFEPTGTVPVTGRVHKTCLSPYANSGTRVYLVPGNTEALSESNRMPLP